MYGRKNSTTSMEFQADPTHLNDPRFLASAIIEEDHIPFWGCVGETIYSFIPLAACFFFKKKKKNRVSNATFLQLKYI